MSSPNHLDDLDDLDLDEIPMGELEAALAEDNQVDMDVFTADDDINWLVSQFDGTALQPTALSVSPTFAVPSAAPPLLAPQQSVAAPAPPAFLTATAGVTSTVAPRTSATKRKAPDITSGCTCKKTRCLKKYCECYRVGKKCNPDVCSCRDCANTKDRVVEEEKLKGCTCRRNKCLKKYCECFRASVTCDPSKCSCLGCQNTGTDAPVANKPVVRV